MSSPPSSPLLSLIPTTLPSLTLVPDWARAILTKADRGLDTVPATIPNVSNTDDSRSPPAVHLPDQKLKRRPSDSNERADSGKRATWTKRKPDVIVISDSDSDSTEGNAKSETDEILQPFCPAIETRSGHSPSESLSTPSWKARPGENPSCLPDNVHDSTLPGTLSSVPKEEPISDCQSGTASCSYERKWKTPSPYKRRNNTNLSTAARGWRTAPTSTRNKAVRRQMVGVACSCCEEFYKECDLPLSSLDFIQGPRFSRRDSPSPSSLSRVESKSSASPDGNTELSPSGCFASQNDQTVLAKRISFVSRHRHHADEVPQGDPSQYWDVNLPDF
ncbi:hypothetical protein IWQ62_003048 [Dispira parvispora]|uniref:DNA endonuclease activator Ctp1 C-terminal domain-containing protein n=1 Tax=Dispira parvispora TaxID=1520584 RepID=A0A9W8ASK0_9FUNG|nr:hypothetical protein IWQ62_003048 [Dispira parvispora]